MYFFNKIEVCIIAQKLLNKKLLVHSHIKKGCDLKKLINIYIFCVYNAE